MGKSSKVKFIIFALLIFIYTIGCYLQLPNIGLISVLGVFLYNIIENLVRKQRSVFYILFHAFIFLFILDRPIISVLRGDVWWYFSLNTIFVTLFVLLLSMVCLNLGFYWKFTLKSLDTRCFGKIVKAIDANSGRSVMKFMCWGTFITLLASLYKETATMLQLYGNYADQYLGIEVRVPVAISILAGMSVFFLIGYLSMLPSKCYSIVVLILYIMTGIPGILSGGRNAFMIRALFCFIYFVLRECYEKTGKWIGKKEIIAIVAVIPIAVLALGVMNYTREGVGLPTTSPIGIAEDFLYKQGTSFDTLCQTVEYRGQLRDENYVNYTFGELYDFVFYNELSNALLGTVDFGDGNNIYNGTLSNNLAHRISYIVLGDSYLTGHGRGTTYFSEIYLDFGYLGIVLFNVLIGMFLSRLNRWFKEGIVQRILILNSLLYFYMIPRLSFFSIFSFFISYYFWLFVIIFLFVLWISHTRKECKKI